MDLTTLWNNIVTSIQFYAPSILGAIVLIVIAWLVATILRAVVVRVLQAIHFDERFGRSVGDPHTVTPLSKTVGNIVFWVTILFFLPAILGALNFPGILLPVTNMVNSVLLFLPNIVAAVLILLVGWFVASIVKRVLVTVFEAIGVDKLASRVGLASALGTQRLSQILATIVYLIILVPVLIAALNALKLDAITAPASAMLNNILTAIPNIFAAFFLLAIAYVVGRVVASLVTNVLTAVGFNRLMGALGLGRAQAVVDRTVEAAESPVPTSPSSIPPMEPILPPMTRRSPSDIAGYLVLVAVMLLAAVEALRLLGFTALATLGVQFLFLLGQVFMGLVIFAIGLWLANLAASVIQESGSRWGNVLAPAARIAILVLAGAMALRQMGLATEIVNLAFGLLLGGIAVAVALAFGLGGRELAAQLLSEWRGALHEHAERPTMTGIARRRDAASRSTTTE